MKLTAKHLLALQTQCTGTGECPTEQWLLNNADTSTSTLSGGVYSEIFVLEGPEIQEQKNLIGNLSEDSAASDAIPVQIGMLLRQDSSANGTLREEDSSTSIATSEGELSSSNAIPIRAGLLVVEDESMEVEKGTSRCFFIRKYERKECDRGEIYDLDQHGFTIRFKFKSSEIEILLNDNGQRKMRLAVFGEIAAFRFLDILRHQVLISSLDTPDRFHHSKQLRDWLSLGIRRAVTEDQTLGRWASTLCNLFTHWNPKLGEAKENNGACTVHVDIMMGVGLLSIVSRIADVSAT